MARFTAVLREVLVRFERTPYISQSDIAHDLGRNRSSIHAACQRLVKLGYLDRNDQGDYRVTETGRSMLRVPTSAMRYLKCPDCGRRIAIQ